MGKWLHRLINKDLNKSLAAKEVELGEYKVAMTEFYRQTEEIIMERDKAYKRIAELEKALKGIADSGENCLLGSCCFTTNHSSINPCEIQEKTHSAFKQMASMAKQALSPATKEEKL